MDQFLASVERRAYGIAKMAVGQREEALDIVGHDVETVGRGDDAVVRLRRSSYDVLLSDLQSADAAAAATASPAVSRAGSISPLAARAEPRAMAARSRSS